MEEVALTPEERHQLLSALRELDPKAPREQRRDPRRRIQLNLWITPLGEKSPEILAMLVNVSAQGVGLHLERALKLDQKFLLRLRFVEGGGWLVLCQTRNVRALRLAFKIGAAFLDHVDDPTGKSKPPLDWMM